MACQENHEAVVERLLAHGAIDVNQATTDDGTTSGSHAIRPRSGGGAAAGHDAIAEPATTSGGATPLYIACQENHEAVVERLLAGDRCEPGEDEQWCHSVHRMQNNHEAVVERLLAQDAIDVTRDGRGTPLYYGMPEQPRSGGGAAASP